MLIAPVGDVFTRQARSSVPSGRSRRVLPGRAPHAPPQQALIHRHRRAAPSDDLSHTRLALAALAVTPRAPRVLSRADGGLLNGALTWSGCRGSSGGRFQARLHRDGSPPGGDDLTRLQNTDGRDTPPSQVLAARCGRGQHAMTDVADAVARGQRPSHPHGPCSGPATWPLDHDHNDPAATWRWP
jgi:hypothetical protein